jgi:hypothetical protein
VRPQWAIPLLCAGLAGLAVCLILPAADEDRRLVREQAALQRELDHLHAQADRYDAFLDRLGRDSELAARLAVRQLNRRDEGSATVDWHANATGVGRSPFVMLAVEEPPPVPPAQALPQAARWLAHPRHRLWLGGGCLLAILLGLWPGRR